MWRDICVANRAALLDELDAYTAVLARLRAVLRRSAPEAGPVIEVGELRIDVPERPIDLVFGGAGGHTLFILAHHALFAVRVRV